MKRSFLKYGLIFLAGLVLSAGPFIATGPTLPLVHAGQDGTNVPERICLTPTQDPSIGMSVSWRAKKALKDAGVQIIVSKHMGSDLEKTRWVEADSTFSKNNEEGFSYYAALGPLTENTWYSYRVGSQGHFSEWNRFKTASANREDFTFLYFGDVQNQIESSCSQVIRAAVQTIPNPAFMLFAGDLVNDGADDFQWQQFFNALGWIPRTTPIVPVAGNHEYPDKRFISPAQFVLPFSWPEHFKVPGNGPEFLKETVYTFRFQGVRFIILDGNRNIKEQAEWMEKILLSNELPWVIASIHQPVYSISKRKDNTIFQKVFVPVFDRFNVDLVLQGHHHAYSRTFPLKNHQPAKKDEKGTVYIMSVTGPKFYPTSNRYADLMARTGARIQLFQSVRVQEDKIEFTAYDLTGSVFDYFTIVK